MLGSKKCKAGQFKKWKVKEKIVTDARVRTRVTRGGTGDAKEVREEIGDLGEGWWRWNKVVRK